MTASTTRTHVVILDIDRNGPIYLGRLDGPNQGVCGIQHATVYTERGARTLAAQYPRAVAAPVEVGAEQAKATGR